MACWISDGSSGFTINENIVTYVDDQGGDNVFNCIWQDGDGVSTGMHYWKINFQNLEEGAGVGLTSREHFKEGYACKAIKYLGNLSNGGALLVGSFGPRPSAGDIIGMLAIFEDDRLKVYIDVNGDNLGLAFDVPASTFKSVFPLVSFHKSGSATCTKQAEIPNISNRSPKTYSGIEGDWTLTNLQENGITMELECVPTTKIEQLEENKYSWHVKVVNSISSCLSRDGEVWNTSDTFSTKKLGLPEWMKNEFKMNSLIREVKTIYTEPNGILSIKSDTISSQWTRYDSAPGPYVGDPFA